MDFFTKTKTIFMLVSGAFTARDDVLCGRTLWRDGVVHEICSRWPFFRRFGSFYGFCHQAVKHHA